MRPMKISDKKWIFEIFSSIADIPNDLEPHFDFLHCLFNSFLSLFQKLCQPVGNFAVVGKARKFVLSA